MPSLPLLPHRNARFFTDKQIVDHVARCWRCTICERRSVLPFSMVGCSCVCAGLPCSLRSLSGAHHLRTQVGALFGRVWGLPTVSRSPWVPCLACACLVSRRMRPRTEHACGTCAVCERVRSNQRVNSLTLFGCLFACSVVRDRMTRHVKSCIERGRQVGLLVCAGLVCRCSVHSVIQS